ncbi:MAG: response regulator [Deltaproteobacteria bacterium]|nr:response regulator [Deltaproteobacteria bacterium]
MVRALVIDDSRALRSLTGRMLCDLGFEVVEACHGKDALERLREGTPPTIALVDWNMPERNGLDFVRSLRRDDTYKDVLVMMVTTETEATQMISALGADANEYLMKPFTRGALIERLDLLSIDHA